jgi:hypothetical protein
LVFSNPYDILFSVVKKPGQYGKLLILTYIWFA